MSFQSVKDIDLMNAPSKKLDLPVCPKDKKIQFSQQDSIQDQSIAKSIDSTLTIETGDETNSTNDVATNSISATSTPASAYKISKSSSRYQNDQNERLTIDSEGLIKSVTLKNMFFNFDIKI